MIKIFTTVGCHNLDVRFRVYLFVSWKCYWKTFVKLSWKLPNFLLDVMDQGLMISKDDISIIMSFFRWGCKSSKHCFKFVLLSGVGAPFDKSYCLVSYTFIFYLLVLIIWQPLLLGFPPIFIVLITTQITSASLIVSIIIEVTILC